MKKLFILIFFAFISCNSEMSLEKKFEVTYDLHIAENNIYNQSLLENIKLKMQEIKNVEAIQKINICDSLSNEYFDYLTTLEKEVKEQGNEIFFDGDVYSKKGNIYVEKTNKYKTEIEKLTHSKNFIKRLNFTFNMKDIKSNDNIYIRNLDYFFKGFPKIQSAAFISDKKRRVLEFENELIDEILMESK